MIKQEIKQEIEQLKQQLFYENMSDYINWDNYNKIENRIKELEKELEEM